MLFCQDSELPTTAPNRKLTWNPRGKLPSQLCPDLDPVFELEKRETQIPILLEEKLRPRGGLFFKSLTRSQDPCCLCHTWVPSVVLSED